MREFLLTLLLFVEVYFHAELIESFFKFAVLVMGEIQIEVVILVNLVYELCGLIRFWTILTFGKLREKFKNAKKENDQNLVTFCVTHVIDLFTRKLYKKIYFKKLLEKLSWK